MLLVLAGCCSLLMTTGANILIQSSSNPAISGRFMSLYVLIFFGDQVIGGLLLGWIVEAVGPRWVMVVFAEVPLLAVLVLGSFLALSSRR